MAKEVGKTLVLGGARSGKSRYAQTLAAPAASVLLVVTAEAGDDEMRAKIARHRADRLADGLEHWVVREEPIALDACLVAGSCGLVLIDCLTFFVANLLALEDEERDEAERLFLEALALYEGDVILVSNEAGQGVVPDYASGRLFRDRLGELNQKVAAICTDVVLMVAGLPLRLKGAGRR